MTNEELHSVDRILGGHGARLDAMEHTLDAIAKDVAKMNQAFTQIQGGWKLVLTLATVIGAAIGWVLDLWHRRP